MYLQLVFTISTVSIASLFLFYWKLIRPGKLIYNALRAQGIPCEPFVPLIGQLPQLYQYRKQNQLLKYHEDLSDKHGLIFLFGLGLYPRLVVQDADLIADILGRAHAQDYYKPADLSFRLKPLIGLHNLLISNGAEHERARKMLNPAFHFENLQSMIPTMIEQTMKTIDKMLMTCQTSINLQNELSILTLSIVASSAFGENFETMANAREIVCEAFIEALDAIVNRTLCLIDQVPLFSRLPFWGKDIVDKGCEKASSFVEQIIANRRLGRSTNVCVREDILELLLSAVDSQGKKFTDEEIKQEAMVFVLAGHQSTGDLMTWIMYILMTNPSVLRACQEEIDRVLPNGILPTYDKLNDLNICESVIYETLRLYPPIPFFVRQCIREHTIQSSDQHFSIPVGATILINTYLVHRHTNYWSHPLEFDYTRWTRDPQTGLKPRLTHPYCYLPFASGSRNCIGQNFALLEAKIILAMLIQRCQFELEPKNQTIAVDVRITMRPKFGLFSKVTRRQ
jgi:cytochrome P450 / NADPH-cytochrome P450 reductase